MEMFDGGNVQNDEDTPIINSTRFPNGKPFSAVTNLAVLTQYFELSEELYESL